MDASRIIDLLLRVPLWKRVSESPERIDALEDRLARLEALVGPRPGEACPSCSLLSLRVVATRPHPTLGRLGARVRTIRCEKCGFQEEKIVDN